MTLPVIAELLVGMLGTAAAIRMMERSAFGGITLDVPKSEVGRGQQSFAAIAEVIGMDAAKRFCAHFGGDRIYIPCCANEARAKRNRNIVAAYNAGLSVRQLSRQNCLSDRQIRMILKTTDLSESAQISLF